MEENKSRITQELCKLLRQTNHYSDVERLEYKRYDDGPEEVIMTFENGYKKRVDVSADSGYALILDVINQTE